VRAHIRRGFEDNGSAIPKEPFGNYFPIKQRAKSDASRDPPAKYQDIINMGKLFPNGP
jgi:hypothetical protein